MVSETNSVLTILVLTFIISQETSCFQRSFGRFTKRKDSQLDFSQLARRYGYTSEEHSVVTEDGYILKTFRMRAKHCEGDRPPVMLMHGLLTSSDAFLDAGPKHGLAYHLADACYDVWLGNSRGNYYARAHTKLDPDKDREFWNFSYDQMGYYDNPATVDYILNKTAREKLSYIGYSQGTGIAFIMCSERPGYSDKLNIFINLAPSSRHLNTKSRFTKAISLFFMIFEEVFDKHGIYEVLGRPERYWNLINKFCHSKSAEATIRFILKLLDSKHDESLTSSAVRTVCGHFSAGTSLHNLAQYGQAMISKKFQKFDYGIDNMKVYGSEDPPIYNFGATTAPAVIMYGENDGLADHKDSMWLAAQLPNLLEAYKVPDPQWNHLDFTYSQHAPKLVFPKVVEYLEQYSK